MESKNYVCDCGKLFYNSQSFNGHKSHCKIHQFNKYGSLDKLNDRIKGSSIKCSKTFKEKSEVNSKLKNEKIKADLDIWISEEHKCELCGKIMIEKYASGRFCSSSCSHSRNYSERTREKVENTFKLRNESLYLDAPSRCAICNSIISYNNRRRKTCSNSCYIKLLKLKGVDSGKKSAQVSVKRSKNEILFYSLCKSNFDRVLNNEPMFDGWDADVIIEDLKVAILWNGIWHYKKVRNKQSLEQIQSRDKIKISKIIEFGYKPIVIKDMGSYDEEFVNNKFIEFMKLKDLFIDNNLLEI